MVARAQHSFFGGEGAARVHRRNRFFPQGPTSVRLRGRNRHWGQLALANFSLGLTLGYHINWSGFQVPDSGDRGLQYYGPTHRISLGVVGFFRFKRDVY